MQGTVVKIVSVDSHSSSDCRWINVLIVRIEHDAPDQRVRCYTVERISSERYSYYFVMLDSTVRYLGIDIDDALEMTEQTEV